LRLAGHPAAAISLRRPVARLVWAVRVDRSGVHWFDAEITRITEHNVLVRYRGVTARLDRWKLYLLVGAIPQRCRYQLPRGLIGEDATISSVL
jgi:hypothetical protein